MPLSPAPCRALRSKGHHHQPAAHCRGLRSLTHQKSRRQPSLSLAELRRAPAGAERKRASTPAGPAHSLPRTPPEGAVWPDEVAARRPQAMPGPMACHTGLPPQPAQPRLRGLTHHGHLEWVPCRCRLGRRSALFSRLRPPHASRRLSAPPVTVPSVFPVPERVQSALPTSCSRKLKPKPVTTWVPRRRHPAVLGCSRELDAPARPAGHLP